MIFFSIESIPCMWFSNWNYYLSLNCIMGRHKAPLFCRSFLVSISCFYSHLVSWYPYSLPSMVQNYQVLMTSIVLLYLKMFLYHRKVIMYNQSKWTNVFFLSVYYPHKCYFLQEISHKMKNIILVDSFHYAKSSLTGVFGRSFSGPAIINALRSQWYSFCFFNIDHHIIGGSINI